MRPPFFLFLLFIAIFFVTDGFSITSGEVKQEAKQAFPGLNHATLFDRHFEAVDPQELKRVVLANLEALPPYQEDGFDCEDYAREAIAAMKRKHPNALIGMGLYMAHAGTEKENYHADVIFGTKVLRNGREEWTWAWLDGQTGRIYYLTPHETRSVDVLLI